MAKVSQKAAIVAVESDEMRVKFVRDFDWSPPEKPQVTLAFKAGYPCLVRRVCGEAAIAAGAAVLDTGDTDAGRSAT